MNENNVSIFYRTLCGTPNYIAPEILTKAGHSYEVDVWSIGCIMYTLLVGKPPFETSSLKETYNRIKQVQYRTPSHLSKPAMAMITSMLQGTPSKRPPVSKLMKDIFFTSGNKVIVVFHTTINSICKCNINIIFRLFANKFATFMFNNGTTFGYVGDA